MCWILFITPFIFQCGFTTGVGSAKNMLLSVAFELHRTDTMFHARGNVPRPEGACFPVFSSLPPPVCFSLRQHCWGSSIYAISMSV